MGPFLSDDVPPAPRRAKEIHRMSTNLPFSKHSRIIKRRRPSHAASSVKSYHCSSLTLEQNFIVYTYKYSHYNCNR